MSNGKGWYDPGPLTVAGGEQTQKLIEQMTLPTIREITRDEAMKLVEELERTRPNSPVLARARAILKVEDKAHGKEEK
jgi:hypothetical protein